MQYVNAIFSSNTSQQALTPLEHLPLLSWGAIVIGALVAWVIVFLTISFVGSVVGLLRSGKKPAPLLLVSTNDGFVRVNWADYGADWLGGAKLIDKESGLLLTYTGDDGKRRRARGTVWFTRSKSIPSGTVAIPGDIATKLDLKLGDDPTSCQIQIAAVKRFFFENLWNNGDDAIKISFRTTVWVTVISTIVSILVSYAFAYLVCNGCLK